MISNKATATLNPDMIHRVSTLAQWLEQDHPNLECATSGQGFTTDIIGSPSFSALHGYLTNLSETGRAQIYALIKIGETGKKTGKLDGPVSLYVDSVEEWGAKAFSTQDEIGQLLNILPFANALQDGLRILALAENASTPVKVLH